MLEQLETFHKTRRGYLVFGVGELLLAYLFASIAIDTANLFAYAASVLLVLGGIMNITKVVTFTVVPPAKKARATSKSTKKGSRGRSKK